MATSGPNQAGAVAEFDDGDTPWSNPGNAISDNNSYAVAALPDDQSKANFLDFTTFGSFAGVGAGDTVTHVTVEVAGKTASGNDVIMSSVQLIVGGSVAGSDQTPASTSFTGSESYVSSGAMTVAGFGTTLNGAQASASNFGVRVQFKALLSGNDLSVDACRVTLTGTFTGTNAAPVRPGELELELAL